MRFCSYPFRCLLRAYYVPVTEGTVNGYRMWRQSYPCARTAWTRVTVGGRDTGSRGCCGTGPVCEPDSTRDAGSGRLPGSLLPSHPGPQCSRPLTLTRYRDTLLHTKSAWLPGSPGKLGVHAHLLLCRRHVLGESAEHGGPRCLGRRPSQGARRTGAGWETGEGAALGSPPMCSRCPALHAVPNASVPQATC